MEQWKDVPGYEGCYQVSDLGRVRSVDRYVRTVSRHGTEAQRHVNGQVLKPQQHSGGYLQVGLSGNTHLIGWLVLSAFVAPRPAGLECAHNNGDKQDNTLNNLRWATPGENAADRIVHGTSGKGVTNAQSKLTAENVRAIRASTASQYAIAETFGIRQSTVSKIKLRQRWSHL